VKLTTHLHLISRLRMHDAIRPFLDGTVLNIKRRKNFILIKLGNLHKSLSSSLCNSLQKKKGKAVPVTGREGP
jgi:hypothetical protein